MTASTGAVNGSLDHGDGVSKCPVWHIGDLSGQRERPYISYEGKGISVSTHPGVWHDIMSRDGSLTTEDPDFYRLESAGSEFYYVDPSVSRHPEREWALSSGFVKERSGFRVSYENASGETAYLKEASEERAKQEAEARDGVVEPTTLLDLDKRGCRYWEEAFQQPPVEADPIVIEGLLPVWYGEEQGFDGVWWDEALDPANFSAPRGVVFQSALNEFAVSIDNNKVMG
jgi:hypothetical protein